MAVILITVHDSSHQNVMEAQGGMPSDQEPPWIP
jgi:hypothetical protein